MECIFLLYLDQKKRIKKNNNEISTSIEPNAKKNDKSSKDKSESCQDGGGERKDQFMG